MPRRRSQAVADLVRSQLLGFLEGIRRGDATGERFEMSQAAMALRLGISRAAYNKYLRGPSVPGQAVIEAATREFGFDGFELGGTKTPAVAVGRLKDGGRAVSGQMKLQFHEPQLLGRGSIIRIPVGRSSLTEHQIVISIEPIVETKRKAR
jgi:transcriptional regulator with XRE-family HTH domain